MKKIILLFALFSVTLSSFGQFNIWEVNGSLVKMRKNLYVSQCEVTNGMYMIFVNYIKQSHRNDLLAIAEVDSSKFDFAPLRNHYHSHVCYSQYPVVNIKYDAAILFCNWLTEKYNTNRWRKFKKVVFRLPTEKEWMDAAQAGDSLAIYPWKGDKLRDKYGCNKCCYHVNRVLRPNHNYWYIQEMPMKTGSFSPNKYGIYEMSGNVAEMMIEKGITKGGSWKTDSTFLKIKSRDFFDGNGQESIGFRFFAEIVD